MIELNLSGKVALVTGASRKIGIGAATARTLAQAGANVWTSYYRPYDAMMEWGSRDEEALDLVGELRSMNGHCGGLEMDLSDPGAPASLIEQVMRETGRLDILINNHTFDVEQSIFTLDAASLDHHYAVNVRATTLLCQEFARRFDKAEQGSGRIVNLSSGQGVGPMPGNLPYVITKGAVEALSVTLSAELGPLGITVNAVDPGATDTGWMPPELKADLERRSYVGRVGLPQDTANLIAFLCSEQGGWITGQILHSRGGL